MMLHVGAEDEPSELLILNLVNCVSDDAEYVKTGQNWFSQINIVTEGNRGIVSTADWVRGGNH